VVPQEDCITSAETMIDTTINRSVPNVAALIQAGALGA